MTRPERVSTRVTFDAPQYTVIINSTYDPANSGDIIYAEFLAYTMGILSIDPGLAVIISSGLENLFAMPAEEFRRPESHQAIRLNVIDISISHTRLNHPEISEEMLENQREMFKNAFLDRYSGGTHPTPGSPVHRMDVELKITKPWPHISVPALTVPNYYFAAGATAFVEHTVRAIHRLADHRGLNADLRNELISHFQHVGSKYLEFYPQAALKRQEPTVALGHFMKAIGIYYHKA